MSEKKDAEPSKKESDAELDELLKSALEDFSKVPASGAVVTTTAQTKGNDQEAVVEEATKTDVEWTEEFIAQAAAQFQSNMTNLLSNMGSGVPDVSDVSPEQIQQNLQRMAEAAAQVVANPQSLEPTQQSDDFAAAISQTLQGLSLGAENLQSPFNERDMLSMFGGVGGGGGGGGGIDGDAGNAFLPFMQGMMQSLLSKDVLYPSLKDLLDRYPAWLAERRATLAPADIERYESQQELMRDVCTELEAERPDDTADVKRQRFDRVLALMQRMQDLGQPPADLVGDAGPGLQFDEHGNLALPPDLNTIDPNQCSIV